MITNKISLPRWNEITAVFGGRFDPPHLGHRQAVQGLLKNPGVKQVLVIPSAAPPHKPTVASIESRLAMTRLNFAIAAGDSFPAAQVQVDDREIRRNDLNPDQPSFTFDTLKELRKIDEKLAFVVGTDQLPFFHRWAKFPEILALAHWIVLERATPGETFTELAQQTLRDWSASGLVKPVQERLWQVTKGQTFGSRTAGSTFVTILPTQAVDVSSTFIRETIARTGASPADTLLPSVAEYLMLTGLYGIRTISK